MNKEEKNIICPNCQNPIFQKSEKKLKVRTNIIIFEKAVEGKDFYADIKCGICKELVRVPIKLDSDDSKVKHIILEKNIGSTAK